MSRNVLVVAGGDVDGEELGRRVGGGEAVNVRVVTPASRLSTAQWLASDEDSARDDAGRVADRVAGAIPQEAEPEVGDPDPKLAVEDALRAFPADEVVVVTGGEVDPAAVEAAAARFRVPVRHVSATAGGDAATEAPVAAVASGRSEWTPFLLLGSVALTIAVVAGIVIAVTLVLWLTL